MLYAAGFAIAWIFLFGNLLYEGHYGMGKILCGSLIGAIFIALTVILSLIAVTGARYVHIWAAVTFCNLSTAFSHLSRSTSVERG